MIDPSIALSYRPTPLDIDTPTQTMTATQNLTNLQNAAKLQQARLVGDQQENQARDMQMKTAAAMNQSLSANTRINPDGTVAVDHAGVVRTLTQGGFGAAAQQYQDAQTKREQEITKLSSDKLTLADQQHDAVVQSIGKVLGVTDPQQRSAMWAQEVKATQAAKIPGSETLNPAQVPDDATLQSMLIVTKEGQHIIQSRIAQQNADTSRKREDTYAQREEDYRDIQAERNRINDEKAQKGRYTKTSMVDENRNPMVLDSSTGKLIVDPDITVKPVAGKGGGASASRAAGVEDRYNDRAVKHIEGQEAKLDNLRTALGQTDAGYLNEKGERVAWDKAVPRRKDETDQEYRQRSAPVIAGLKHEMQARLAQATDQRVTLTKQKNDYIRRNGGEPEVDDQQAEQAIRGVAKRPAAQQQPAAPAAASAPQQSTTTGEQPSTKPFTPAQAKFGLGQTVTVGGKSYKVSGYKRNGNFVLDPLQ